MNIKNIFLIFLGCVIGGAIVALLMFSQIKNRYQMGLNTGKIEGVNKVFIFLEQQVRNDSTITIKPLGKYLDHKASRLSVVEIKGVQTIRIE